MSRQPYRGFAAESGLFPPPGKDHCRPGARCGAPSPRRLTTGGFLRRGHPSGHHGSEGLYQSPHQLLLPPLPTRASRNSLPSADWQGRSSGTQTGGELSSQGETNLSRALETAVSQHAGEGDASHNRLLKLLHHIVCEELLPSPAQA